MGFFSSLVDPGGIFGGNTGENLQGLIDPVGSSLSNWGAMPDFWENASDKVNDYTSNLADFEQSQLSDWVKRFKNDPTQLLIGAGDPFSAKMWGGITGKDYEPYVNQYGGPTQGAYQSAENKGVDTSNSRGSHAIAQAIASYYGGAGAGAGLGAAGTATGVGAAGGQVLGGAAMGAGNAWAQGGNVGQGAVSGGLGGYLSSLDYGGAAGMEQGLLRRGLNGAIGGGLSSVLGGGNTKDIGTGALMGAGKGVGGGLYNQYFNDFPDEGTLGGSQRDEFGEGTTTGYNVPQQDTANVQAQGLSGTYGTPQAFRQSMGAEPAQSSAVDNFIAALSGGAQKAGGMEGLGNMAGQAMGLYDAMRSRRRAKEQASNLQNLFSPNSPYAQQMRQRLERQDAATGRRSQVGTREVELAGRLAEAQARQAPQLQSLYNEENSARNRMLSNSLRLGSGLYDMYRR